MKKTVVACDKCGRVSKEMLEIDVDLPRARVVAEDDDSYTETLDLCPPCAATELMALLDRLPGEQRTAAVKRLQRQG